MIETVAGRSGFAKNLISLASLEQRGLVEEALVVVVGVVAVHRGGVGGSGIGVGGWWNRRWRNRHRWEWTLFSREVYR